MRSAWAIGCAFLTFFPVFAAAAEPQVDSAKEADIRRLLEVTGATKLATMVVSQMAEHIKPLLEKGLPPGERRHQITETFVNKLVARATGDDLMKIVIPIYDRHLSHEDIKGLIQFYESPLGQRYIKVLPTMMQESSTASSQWGQQIAMEVLQELQQEYPELKQPK